MDKIDIGVGFEQVAPHPLALMRLARHQKNAQLVAHPFDGDDRAIVDVGQFAWQRRNFEFKDIGPGVLDRRLDIDGLADRRVERCNPLAVAAHFKRDRLAGIGGVEHARADRLLLADYTEARRLDQFDAPVSLARMAGDQRVQRRFEAERRDIGGNVMDNAVGDENRRADPVGRNVAEA